MGKNEEIVGKLFTQGFPTPIPNRCSSPGVYGTFCRSRNLGHTSHPSVRFLKKGRSVCLILTDTPTCGKRFRLWTIEDCLNYIAARLQFGFYICIRAGERIADSSFVACLDLDEGLVCEGRATDLVELVGSHRHRFDRLHLGFLLHLNLARHLSRSSPEG